MTKGGSMDRPYQEHGDDDRYALSKLEIESIEYFVSFVQLLGLPKSVGEIYGVLFVSLTPLTLDDIVTRLRVSKGSASQGLTVLRNLGAVKPVFVPGERRDHYEADFDLTRIVNRFFSEKLEPRLENGAERLDRMEALTAGECEDHPAFARIKALRKWQHRGGSAMKMILKFLGKK